MGTFLNRQVHNSTNSNVNITLFMPAKDKKPRVPTARAKAVSKLRLQSKELKAQLTKVNRDLRSFGVGKRKKKTKNA